MEISLEKASAMTDEKQKMEEYKLVLSSVVSKDAVHVTMFVDHILADNVSLVILRQIMECLGRELDRFEPDSQRDISQHIVTHVQPRILSLEEQASRTKRLTKKLVFHVGRLRDAIVMRWLGTVSIVAALYIRALLCHGYSELLLVDGIFFIVLVKFFFTRRDETKMTQDVEQGVNQAIEADEFKPLRRKMTEFDCWGHMTGFFSVIFGFSFLYEIEYIGDSFYIMNIVYAVTLLFWAIVFTGLVVWDSRKYNYPLFPPVKPRGEKDGEDAPILRCLPSLSWKN